MGALWLWHVPTLYNAALANDDVRAAQHLCFVAAATAFWWSVLSPAPARQLTPMATFVYLMSAATAYALFGLVVEVVPQVRYLAYTHPEHVWGTLPIVREAWGLTPGAGRQLGARLLAVEGGVACAGVTLARLLRWGATETRTAQLATAPTGDRP